MLTLMMIEWSMRIGAVGIKLPDEDSDELLQRGMIKFARSSAPLDARFYPEDLRRMALLHDGSEWCGVTWFDGERWLRRARVSVSFVSERIRRDWG